MQVQIREVGGASDAGGVQVVRCNENYQKVIRDGNSRHRLKALVCINGRQYVQVKNSPPTRRRKHVKTLTSVNQDEMKLRKK